MTIVMHSIRAKIPVMATAVPWIFAAAAWVYLRRDLPVPMSMDGLLGTEAAFRAGVALTGFWVLSGLSLMGCSFYLISRRGSPAAWVLTVINALGFAAPMLVFAWLNYRPL